MKRDIRLWIILAFAALAFAACTPCTPDLSFIPVHSLPPNHSLVTDQRPTLSWTYGSECDPPEYYINLWVNATNGTIVNTGFGGLTGSPDKEWAPSVDLTPGVAYLWRVHARNGTLSSPGSGFWEFIVGPACDPNSFIAPDPVEPALGEKVHTQDPTYIWDYTDPTCTPEGYHLQVSSQADFSILAVDIQDTNPIKAWTTGVLLTDCDDYYWRVAASNGSADGPWSTVEEFYVDAFYSCLCTIPELVQPIPIWPGPYQIVNNTLPVLQWSFPGACEVEGYSVHLSDIYDMSDTSRFGGSPSTTWTPANPLENGIQYWWQVAAGVDADFGLYSSKRSFFVGPACTDPGELVAPVQIAPENNATVTEGYAILRYRPGDPPCIPDGYIINLNQSPTYSGPNELGEFGLPGTTVITELLTDCERYYWKVAAIQDGVIGPYSDSRMFYTNQSGMCLFFPFVTPMAVDLRCFLGPDPELFGRGGYLLLGEQAEVFGRNMRGDYVIGQDPDGVEGTRCYLRTEDVELSVPISDLRVLNDPPIIVETKEPEVPVCHEKIPTQEECEAAGGVWTAPPLGASGRFYCKCD
jgi:hypothetical protein